MKAVLENIEKVLKSKRQDKHARYVALDIVRQSLKQLEPKKATAPYDYLRGRKLSSELTEQYNKQPHKVKSKIVGCLQLGQLISAIKEYRSITGLGLKDAKDTIELHPNLKMYTKARLEDQEKNLQRMQQNSFQQPF